MPGFYEIDSEDEDQGRIVPLTEFTSESLIQPQAAPKVIPKLLNTFRNGGRAYAPTILQKKEEEKMSIAELEATEKNSNSIYGLSRRTNNGTKTEVAKSEVKQEAEEQTLDEHQRAIEELINPTDVKNDRKITLNHGNQLFSRGDGSSHPEMSTIAEYEEMPVEDYGLAMLRGMGYVPENDKKADKEVKRRPDFLGLGATQRPEETISKEDLAKKKFQRRKEEKVYTPVVLRNKRTGKVITEEELAKERERAESQSSSTRNGHQERDSREDRDRREDRSSRHSSDRHRSSREDDRYRSRHRSRDRSDRHYKSRRRSRSR